MANSIASRGKAVADNGFLDLLGSDAQNFEPISFKTVQDSLLQLAALYILEATNNLEKVDKAGRQLASSIKATPVKIMGKLYTIDINIAAFYKFVDKGVKGWADEKGGSSPYQFKNYTGKAPRKGKMVAAIQEWLISQARQGTVKGIKKTLSKREGFQRSIKDANLGAAIAITKSIRKKGLKPTHFWTDAEEKMIPIAEDIFGQAIKVDIINAITGK